MSKCGCVYCSRVAIPQTRGGWKSLKNHKGHYFGTTKKVTKGGKVPQQKRPK